MNNEKSNGKKSVFWRKERHIQVNFWIKAQVGLAQAHFICGEKSPPTASRTTPLTDVVDEGGNQVSEPARMSLADSTSFITPLMGLDEVEED